MNNVWGRGGFVIGDGGGGVIAIDDYMLVDGYLIKFFVGSISFVWFIYIFIIVVVSVFFYYRINGINGSNYKYLKKVF